MAWQPWVSSACYLMTEGYIHRHRTKHNLPQAALQIMGPGRVCAHVPLAWASSQCGLPGFRLVFNSSSSNPTGSQGFCLRGCPPIPPTPFGLQRLSSKAGRMAAAHTLSPFPEVWPASDRRWGNALHSILDTVLLLFQQRNFPWSETKYIL